MFYDMFARVNLNIDLAEKEAHTFASKGERQFLKLGVPPISRRVLKRQT